ncbi:hypothetical protein RyT2_18690 [Pseudolactococcus yaeyamensis]
MCLTLPRLIINHTEINDSTKIKRIEIGETYVISGSYTDYIKFVDNEHFLLVETSKEDKNFPPNSANVQFGKYEKKKENFAQTEFISLYFIIPTNDKETEKNPNFVLEEQDVLGEIPSIDYIGIAIKKWRGSYYLGKVPEIDDENNKINDKPTNSSDKWLKISSKKLPDTVEEYLSQYTFIQKS